MATLDGIRSIEDLTLENQRVFIRTDFDVPVSHGTVGDDRLLRASLPTVQRALAAGARVVLGAQLGEPRGRATAELSLEGVALRLSELIGADVYLPDDCVGEAARKVVQDLRPGQLCLLENLGFHAEESANDEGFARKLAAFTDVYLNDAPLASRSALASVSALPRLVHERGMGSLLAAQLHAAVRLTERIERPFVAVLGGAASAEAWALLQALIGKCNTLCLGGVLGNTLLAARGTSMKASRVATDYLARARTLLTDARDRRVEIVLPVDLVVAQKDRAANGFSVAANEIADDHAAFDVGPKTVGLFSKQLEHAKTVLCYGPLGQIENPAFARGSEELLRAVSASSAFSVVSGQGNLTLLSRASNDVSSKIGFVSTAGSTTLDLIEGRRLPGVEALRGGAT